jgi:Uma2 family endonuclease
VALSDVFLNDKNIYQPDVYFVSNDNAGHFEKDGVHGAPDLAIEILSPGTEQLDKNEKLKVYETYGVKEYWLIDTERKKPRVIMTTMAALN